MLERRRQIPAISLARAIGASYVVLVGLLALQQCRASTLERALAAATLAPTARAVAIAAARVDTVRVELAGASARVDTVVGKVRVDTLMLAPQSREDTAKAVAQLPALAAAHASLQGACTALVYSCERFSVAASSLDTASRAHVTGLEHALETARPSRLAAAWNKTKLPLAFLGGLLVGVQLVK